MDWQTMLIFGVIALIFAAMVLSLVATHIRMKKNPQLTFNFLKNLSYNKETQVVKISDKLELHLHNDFFLYFELYAKNEHGEFIQVDKRSYYRPPNDIIRFEEPWHNEIAAYLNTLYKEEKKKKQEERKQKQMEIQNIKQNWK